MNDERLKQAYDKMNPDTQSEKRMLAEIIRKGESHMDRKFTVEPVKPSRWAAIPAVMAILAMIALSVFVAVRFDLKDSTANDPTQEHDTVPNLMTESDTHLESEVPPNHEDSPEPMTIPSYGERPPITVYPQPQTLDINKLTDCFLHISILSVTDSIYGNEITAEVFVEETYDAEDIAMLRMGDTIVIGSQSVEISELDYDEVFDGETGLPVKVTCLDINGGFMGGGYTLMPYGEDTYRKVTFGYEASMYSIGVVNLPVSEDFIFTDYSNPKNGDVVYSFEDLVYDESLREDGFKPHDTVIEVKNGIVTQLIRYCPPYWITSP